MAEAVGPSAGGGSGRAKCGGGGGPPPGNPTGNSRRTSQQVKAVHALQTQFGAGNPFLKPHFGLADTRSAVEGSKKLMRCWDGGRDARINTERCYASSTVQSGVTEVLAVQAFNAVKLDLLQSRKLSRDHPHLVPLAKRVHWQCKPVAHNEADFHLVEQLADGSTKHFAVFQQQATRYLPTNGCSGKARAALLTPRNPSFKEQPAAAEVDGFVIYVYLQCAVGAARDVQHMLDARGGGVAVGARSADFSFSASDGDDEDALVEQCGLMLGLDQVAEQVEVGQQSALDAAAQEAGCEPEGAQEAQASAGQAEQQLAPWQLPAGEASSSGAAAPAPDTAKAAPRWYRYSELVAAAAVVDCAEPADVVVAFLQLLHDGKVSAQDPHRSSDQGLQPPAVMRNPRQVPISRAILSLAPELQAALGGDFRVFPNLLECTAPGLHIVLPTGWQSPAVTLAAVEELLQLKHPGASIAAVGRLLKECHCGGAPLSALETLAAALCGEQPLPATWAEVRNIALPAVHCLLEQHSQLAHDASAGTSGSDAGRADEAGGSAAVPRRLRRKGDGAGHSSESEQPSLKKHLLGWSAKDDAHLLELAPRYVRTAHSGAAAADTIVDFEALCKELGRTQGGVRQRFFRLTGTSAASGTSSCSAAAGSTPASAGAPLAAAISGDSPAAATTQAVAPSATPGKRLGTPTFSAAADPRLQGKKSLFMRVGVVRSGAVGLSHSLAGASYSFDFGSTITRYQLLAAKNPNTGMTYIANVLQLQRGSLLGAASGLDARGHLLVSEADLAKFEVPAAMQITDALQRKLLPLLLSAAEQVEARSVLAALARAVNLATVSALHCSGASPFTPGWFSGLYDSGACNYERGVQALCRRSPQVARCQQLIQQTGMVSAQQTYTQVKLARYRAMQAGIALEVPRADRRSVESEAKRLYGGDVQRAAYITSAKGRFAELLKTHGINPSAKAPAPRVGREDWRWVARAGESTSGLSLLIDTMRREFEELKSGTFYRWWYKLNAKQKKLQHQ